MTKEQFEQLKIGDTVLSPKAGEHRVVTDIHRGKQLINTGGTWRRRQDVTVPEEWKDSLGTHLPEVKEYTFPIPMLKKLGLIQSAIVVTVRRAGKEGYVGTLTALRLALQLDIPQATFFAAWKNLHILRLVTMEKIGSKYNRFQLSEEAMKLFA